MRSKGLSTSRTYTMAPRAKFILDAISIMSVGIDKSELVNMAVFTMAAEVMRRREPDVAHITVRNAVDGIRTHLKEIGYTALLESVIPDMRDQTSLDAFLDMDVSEPKVVDDDGIPVDVVDDGSGDEVTEFLQTIFPDYTGGETDNGH